VTVLKSDVIWKEEKKETVSEEGETEP
jgi:hypothetical protein